MSLENILSKEKLPNGKVRVTFDAHDGHRVYEYSGAAAKLVMKGHDPSGIAGRHIETKKHAKRL